MGVSTDGQICFGVVFEEGYEFPWDASSADGDFEEWWLYESGWKWEGEEPFTEAGEYAPGFSEGDPRIAAWYDSQRAWKEAHPCPVEVVNYQAGEAPAYMLAVRSSLISASRGNPERFDPSDLYVTTEDQAALLDFCKRYDLEPEEEEPRWYLSSYWG